jgi:dipeptidase D
MDPFAGLEPAGFWRHLEALIAIPRPSHEEDAAVAHVVAWADARGYPTRRDGAGNLVVQVPATPAREGAPTVILQGHLDIVCERDPASPYEPRAGRIHVVRDGDWLSADGTTLGADNGVAIAAMMALAEGDAPHGPLELLMTVAEEVGMAGAAELDPALISGSVLLNLDSEEDATLTVGCAGGADTFVRFEVPREPAGAEALTVTVSGGRGGHSGGDIAAGRSNAIKLLARALSGSPGVRIASLDGGSSRNAIPRDAVAVVVGDGDAIARAGRDAVAAYAKTDAGVRVDVEPAAAAAGAWTAEAGARILDLIAAIPHGPLGMSADFPGVVETSSCLSVAATSDGRLELTCLSRSANDAVIPEVTGAIAAAARLAGAHAEAGRRYPGWLPDLGSPALATAQAVHERLFGAAPHVSLTHGGLETAVIGARKPGLDMISFGPLIEGPHAPGERLHVASAERFTRLLAALADELSR